MNSLSQTDVAIFSFQETEVVHLINTNIRMTGKAF